MHEISKKYEKIIEEVKSLNWQFYNKSFIHPHNNDLIESYYFRSPRMSTLSPIEPETNLKRVEAKSVALSFLAKHNAKIFEEFTLSSLNFFLDHPNEDVNTNRIYWQMFIQDEN